jgi:hypothetical protein
MVELMFRCVSPVPDESCRAGMVSQASEVFDHATGITVRAPAFAGNERLRQETRDVA